MTVTIASRRQTLRHSLSLGGALVAVNLLVWAWVWTLFQGQPVLLGTATLAWGLGLRHALDADHIAAIDNVTRKLMRDGKRPLTVGLWFAIGHSSIVLLAAVTIALVVRALAGFAAVEAIGGIIATIASAVFLLALAAMNFVVFRSLWKAFVRVQSGGEYREDDLDALMGGRGLMVGLFRRMFRLISHSWQMAPLGFVFGMGFDTATEVAIFGLSAREVTNGTSIGIVIVFPLLFACGMVLIDTLDGLIMLNAYDWATERPMRKLRYNMAITFASALAALLVGATQTVALVVETFTLTNGPWSIATRLQANFTLIGCLMVVVFVLCWGVSWIYHRFFNIAE